MDILANYTWSKFIQQSGYLDPYAKVLNRTPSSEDFPHFFKLATVYEFPFGKGKRFGGGARGFVQKLIGGWDWNNQFTLRTGPLAGLPGNVMMLRDPSIKDINWHQYKVQGWSPCVLSMDNTGKITPQSYSIAAGCGTDTSTYSWMVLPNYAPTINPSYGKMRFRPVSSWDAAIHKNVSITERLRAQIRIEVFNVLNHYNMSYGLGYTTSGTSANFGSLFPAQSLTTLNTGLPRVIQLGFKGFW